MHAHRYGNVRDQLRASLGDSVEVVLRCVVGWMDESGVGNWYRRALYQTTAAAPLPSSQTHQAEICL